MEVMLRDKVLTRDATTSKKTLDIAISSLYSDLDKVCIKTKSSMYLWCFHIRSFKK